MTEPDAARIATDLGVLLFHVVTGDDGGPHLSYSNQGAFEPLLGGPIPPGVDALELWVGSIPPPARHPGEQRRDAAWRSEASEVRYRVSGLDGRTRYMQVVTRLRREAGKQSL